MAEATLMVDTRSTYNPETAEDRKVTLEELQALPEPPALGKRHVPIHHGTLATMLLNTVDDHGFEVTSAEWALARKGQRMFSVMTMQPKAGSGLAYTSYPEEMTMALGTRHANDMSEALKVVTGFKVFVCSNLSMSGQGDGREFRKLHTAGLDLHEMLGKAFEDTYQRFVDLDKLVTRLKTVEVTADQAKRVIYDVFTSPEAPVPNQLFPDVHRWYFEAPAGNEKVLDALALPETDDLSDVKQRSLWGISNAFTRAIRKQPMGRQIGSSTKVMRALAAIAGSN